MGNINCCDAFTQGEHGFRVSPELVRKPQSNRTESSPRVDRFTQSPDNVENAANSFAVADENLNFRHSQIVLAVCENEDSEPFCNNSFPYENQRRMHDNQKFSTGKEPLDITKVLQLIREEMNNERNVGLTIDPGYNDTIQVSRQPRLNL